MTKQPSWFASHFCWTSDICSRFPTLVDGGTAMEHLATLPRPPSRASNSRSTAPSSGGKVGMQTRGPPSLFSWIFFFECLKENPMGWFRYVLENTYVFQFFPSIVPLLKWHSLHPWSWAWNRNSLEVWFRSWVICRFPAVNLPGCNRFFWVSGNGTGPPFFSSGGNKNR